MQDAKNRVEAVLFTTGKFLKLEDLSRLTSIGSIGYLKQVLCELKGDYEKKQSSLEIINEKDLWRLNIRKEFLYLTESLLNDAELDKPTQETLAIIAYRQPAIQSDVTNIRGNKSYDHIKKLKEEGFLVSERFGRTRILKLTQKFYDYFDIVEDNLKLKLEGKEVPEEENSEKE
jgi:segregation and condensation protein B